MPLPTNPALEPDLQHDVTRLLQLAVLLRLQLWETTSALETLLNSNLTPSAARRRALRNLDDIISEFCSDPLEPPGATAQRATAEVLISIMDDWPPDEDPAALEPSAPIQPLGAVEFHPEAFTLIWPSPGEKKGDQ